MAESEVREGQMQTTCSILFKGVILGCEHLGARIRHSQKVGSKMVELKQQAGGAVQKDKLNSCYIPTTQMRKVNLEIKVQGQTLVNGRAGTQR